MIIQLLTVLAKKISRFYIVLQYKNVNFFWPVLYIIFTEIPSLSSSSPFPTSSSSSFSLFLFLLPSPILPLPLPHQIQHISWLLLMLVMSEFLSFVQSIVSFSLLSLVSPVSYFAANASKRIIVISTLLVFLKN